MNKIEFISLTLEGFGSYVKHKEFSLKANGVNIIKGHNGAGKTTLFSALTWCLFGKPLKKINKADIPSWKDLRDKEWKGTKVAVKLLVNDISYEVIRHIDYKGLTNDIKGGNSLMILKEGELITESLYKGDQQEFINHLLKMDYKLCTHTVMLGEKVSRFIAASSEDKRYVLESIFDFDRIDKAQKIVSDDLVATNLKANELNVQYNEAKLAVERKQNTLSLQREAEKLFNDGKASKVSLWQSELAHIKQLLGLTQENLAKQLSDLKLLESNAVKLEELKANKKQLGDEYREVESLIAKADKDKNQFNQDIWKINERYSGDCKVCGQSYETFKTQAVIAEEIKLKQLIVQEDERIVGLQDSRKAIVSQGEEVAKQIAVLEAASLELNNLKAGIANSEKDIKAYENKIQEAESSLALALAETFSFDFNALEQELTALADKLVALEPEISALEKLASQLKYWSSVGFTQKGIKGFMFNTMLNKLNGYIKRYANVLGIGINISIDLESALKNIDITVFKDGVEANYYSLSNGEKQKVDICVSFALHDIIATRFNANLLVLDEVFEGLDDYSAMDAVTELIRTKAENKSVFIITPLKSIELHSARVIEIN